MIKLRDQAVLDTALDKGTLNATLKEEYMKTIASCISRSSLVAKARS